MFFPNLISIKKNDWVLEIGTGARPHWRADCFADKYSPDEAHLGQFGGNELKVGGKALFKIENGSLPFKDKSFDYIICSHVFEHTTEEELTTLIKEMERVGKKFYIEFPTAPYDFIYNFDVHTNFMDIIDDTIICLPKVYSPINEVKPFTDFMFHSIRENQNTSFETRYPEIFVVGKKFTAHIPLKIVKNIQDFFTIINPKYKKKLPRLSPSLPFLIKNKIQKIASKYRKPKPGIFFNST